MQKNIIVNLQIEGIHQWPDCNIEEVMFLKHPHRHIFHITCKKLVSHNERDIEIINLKHNIIEYLNNIYYSSVLRCCNFLSLSCESIAELLLTKFDLSYCSVLEDNENGAEVYVS